ncbi:hypothetical protein DCG74_08715 [Bradyrhizobium sp. WBAH42]|nr:hypothetical protein [Bradyrhizobium sp. WBAH30]MDD1544997.1 hypothetical protein [Bradyrhizobium sp. WBAH41]MDD1558426.1 hypothetical protein [Bradyrhizobium sp. WBAH23]MDD1565824.1 hypothetical protein [Bradyrhizobium sp. WBAH33]MDD1591204.1 hypothetical protein [Bradyrhizobium sp. WBAH42]NRB89502.1 hypothetical protein [Bradyrhizobium sp. WBAH10]QCJ88633.1 hypothetical protein DAA57_09065 [Bradyrhizobium yuanmingense]
MWLDGFRARDFVAPRNDDLDFCATATTIPSLRAQRSNPDCLHGKILDCFAALAMTTERDDGQSRSRRRDRHRPMPLRQGHLRDRRACALGLA